MSFVTNTHKVITAEKEQIMVSLSMRAGQNFGVERAIVPMEALQLTTSMKAMLQMLYGV